MKDVTNGSEVNHQGWVPGQFVSEPVESSPNKSHPNFMICEQDSAYESERTTSVGVILTVLKHLFAQNPIRMEHPFSVFHSL